MFFKKLLHFSLRKLFFLRYWSVKKWFWLKDKLLGRYYVGLGVQTRFLYQQSPLFKYRWQELGIDFAKESFDNNPDDQVYFFRKAQKEPFKIRIRIFLDALAGKEPIAYYISEEK